MEYEEHPDPKLKRYVYISKNENKVLSIDEINYFFRQDRLKPWIKTRLWTKNNTTNENTEYINRSLYIKNYCITRNINVNGILKNVPVYIGKRSKL